ncbi:MAG TPA: peptidylprolyl isomerase [Acetobacteraceae bacterium]|jgi:peptidyl-prolyl cis-trans isomerase C
MRHHAVSTARAAIRLFAATLLATSVATAAGLAQPAAAPAPAQEAGNDPVVAKVNGQPIHLSDLKDAAETLPAQAKSMPTEKLYPLLLDQLIDAQAMVAEARKTGLDKDPAVQRQVAAATDQTLENALLRKEVAPQITEQAVRARYDQDVAGKKGEEEVHARHILVSDEATAKKIIAELKKGGDFAALSKQYSKDPGAAQQGGDLGFFKKGDMVPEFSDAAFALKDGEITPQPVHTQFGWHVIQVTEHRQTPPPTFEEAKDGLRQKMVQEGVRKAVAQARAAATVEKFNLDGSPVRATDSAEPPPAK